MSPAIFANPILIPLPLQHGVYPLHNLYIRGTLIGGNTPLMGAESRLVERVQPRHTVGLSVDRKNRLSMCNIDFHSERWFRRHHAMAGMTCKTRVVYFWNTLFHNVFQAHTRDENRVLPADLMLLVCASGSGLPLALICRTWL